MCNLPRAIWGRLRSAVRGKTLIFFHVQYSLIDRDRKCVIYLIENCPTLSFNRPHLLPIYGLTSKLKYIHIQIHIYMDACTYTHKHTHKQVPELKNKFLSRYTFSSFGLLYCNLAVHNFASLLLFWQITLSVFPCVRKKRVRIKYLNPCIIYTPHWHWTTNH